MTSEYLGRYTGLYATPDLVGRREILDQCERILSEESKEPKLVFLHGPGGIGKTRLLQKILEIAHNLPNTRVGETVLDFYDILLHTPVELSDAVFEALTPPFDCFREYQTAAQTLNRARLSGNAIELEKLRQDALDKFDQDLRKLAETRRVVLALDTAERIVYGLSGWMDEIPLADSWDWLIDRLPAWRNVVVFVAGREGAKPAIERIQSERSELVETIKVSSFRSEESLEYFDNIVRLLKDKGDLQFAERLENMPEDFKRGAHAYSQGRPILLSLLVDYLSYPEASDLPEMLRQGQVEKPSEEEIHLYEQALFDRLREGELGETLIALGRVPKGANENLLARLITRKNEKGEDTPISRVEARKRLMDVQSLSVIKIRRIEDQLRFFLHDEMYDLLQRHVYSGYVDAKVQQQAFEAIKTYYQEQREISIHRLNTLYAPVEEQGRSDLDMKELNKAHSAHQALLTEMMYYFLRHDLGRGFRTYSRYTQEAILSRDLLMDLQLQAELLSYLSSPPAPILEEDISVEMIVASLKVRPFARAWALGQYDKGIDEAHNLIDLVEGEWQEAYPVLLAALHTWTANMHTMRGQLDDITEAGTHLEKASLLLSPTEIARTLDPTRLNTLLWYTKAISALAHRIWGYLKRVQGFMKDAEAEYQKAALLLREIDLRCEMAAVKNDMGFAQAELGKYHDGRANVLNALELRKELGHRIAVALSLNTLAAIDVREGRYREARQNSERALAVFRAFSQQQGIGMVLTTLAEATRRYAGTEPLLPIDERIDLLRRSRDYAREAQSLLTMTGDSSRVVEALIEIGCACRDWVWWLELSPRPGDDTERLYKESWDSFAQAADLARESGLIYRYVDALVNRAWLEFYKIEREEEIPEKHPIHAIIDATEKSFPAEAEINEQPQVWAQKGKLYVLKGNLTRRLLAEHRKLEPKGISHKVASLLGEMAENYTYGLEYSNRFSNDYQGIRQAKDSVSERLKNLNSAEMRIFCDKVQELYPDGSTLQTLLINRALWQMG